MNEAVAHQLRLKNEKVNALTLNFIKELEANQSIEVKKVAKNSFLVSKNETSLNVFFIKKGCVRSFVHDSEMREVTIWFTFENEAVFSSISYILELPSIVMIQALENSEVVIVSKKQLDYIYSTQFEINQLGRTIMEKFLVLLSMRSISLQTDFAEVRYKDLIEQYPDILKRVALRHIASYIGVKVETLSRIRANYRKG